MGMKNYSPYAPVVLRYGLVFVFMWFGINQLLNVSMWTSLIPSWATASGLSAPTFVVLNGLFEIAMAILLAFGIKVRLVATLLFLHLLLIVIDVGMNAVGVRDIGLLTGLLSVIITGGDIFTIDTN